ncbi:Catalyzes the cleavage of p-aminobenzoyl-glutamate to p-aminobenzoate and glutamate, subunit A [Microbacterium esteraromaticum]|uniref:Catalyzes the cleavage of p-aminobenzoyl-glutamate to p-aminobenzoate and glutamate, subunit A n=1 Tax=Microbacterium esteraromaticum TaxID=57043 RepID=A0A1R4IHI2_9MICO|nr:dipeptidase [Microbacterium esteraromaticum]SJN19260.1 Catalyzes the cleavage of p-aminobenzoyl-glutamate to p-aminobenzoate and glutamate, subunit A [Microbacterium esteraromaticum]
MTTTASPDPSPFEPAVLEAVALGIPAAVSDIGTLVRIPGIAWPAFDQTQLERSADAVADLARGTGVFDEVRVLRAHIDDTEELGQPAVLATRAARNGRPTILLYAHHDVQPPGDDELWESPPFEPTVRGGRLYGRGAADDKAGIMAHIAALRAVGETLGDEFDLGVSLFIEGEEEYGSRSFARFLRDNADALRADAIVVADSGNLDSRTPGLTVSLRGNARFTLKVRTLAHASHSGMFGGAVPDAMMAAVTLLSTLWDGDGAVAVEGMSSRSGSGTPEYSEATLRDETGLLETTSPIGRDDILGRIWNKPSITITGIDATSVAEASNTLLPEVSVVISARVAPGQDAREAYEAIESHLRAHAPFGAELTFSDVDLGNGFLVDTAGWAVQLTRNAMADGYGVPSVDLGVGGSIPFIADLVREFPAAEILVTGVEDPHSRAHSPNESLHLETFRNAVRTEALMLVRMNARDTAS